MQPMVYLIVPNYRVTPSPDLDPCQGVAMDIIVFQNTTPTGKEVHAPLQSPVDVVVLESGVTLASDPDTGVGVGINLILNELPSALQVLHSKTVTQQLKGHVTIT